MKPNTDASFKVIIRLGIYKSRRIKMDEKNNYEITFSRDLQLQQIDTKVCVTGIVVDKWIRRNDGGLGIQIQDFTGLCNVSFSASETRYERYRFSRGKRIRVYASISTNGRKQVFLANVYEIEFLEEMNQWSAEYDIFEQESLVLTSLLCNKIKEKLTEMKFIEVNTRLITRFTGGELLEPLKAQYSGYGAPAYLSPSPSSQLDEFLAVTFLPKVFTQTVSITSSYRFPNASGEMPIIMAKAINLSSDEENDAILRMSRSIISDLSYKEIHIISIEGQWNEDIANDNPLESGKFTFGTYSAYIPAIGKRWSSVLKRIRRLEDDQGNLLAESATEILNDGIQISTITYYPSQYLNWVKKAPKRQLLNLWKIYDGGSIYV